MIRFHRADLIGLQEVYGYQLDHLRSALPEYEIILGAPLADIQDVPAYNPILFRKGRLMLVRSGHFFLADTPDVARKCWNANLVRGVSWAELKDIKTSKTFFFYNTHFDYFSRFSREMSAQLLRLKIEEIGGSRPYIAAGDYNLFPSLGGPETLSLLTDDTLPGKPLVDAQDLSQHGHHGPTGSWSGFREAGQPGIKPDFLFVDPSVIVLTHGILADTFDGLFPSDHLPVIADLILPL